MRKPELIRTFPLSLKGSVLKSLLITCKQEIKSDTGNTRPRRLIDLLRQTQTNYKDFAMDHMK